MNLPNLSKRLAAIAERIPPCRTLADIGSDHAWLPIYAAGRGLCRQAVAGDINEGPLKAARRNIAAMGLEGRIDARLGDGLAVIEPGEADVVVIAGMGGSTITAILASGTERLQGVRKLLLAPNVGTSLVRRWLHEHGWYLQDECVVEEDGLFYDILEAVPADGRESREAAATLYEPLTLAGGAVASADLLMELGPHLLKRPTPPFFGKWKEELEKRERIVARMKQSKNRATVEKRMRMEQEMNQIREVLSCLPMDKP